MGLIFSFLNIGNTRIISIETEGALVIKSTLIEGFPDEVSLMILARVPLYLHPRLTVVCRAWRDVVNSVHLLKVRQEVNFNENFMCVCSREPDKLWQLHDPRHDVWITIPVLPSHISHLSYFGAVSVAGKLYVLGGGHDCNDETENPIVSTNQVWSYEPVTKRWTLCAPMITARADFACGVLYGKIIVAGGFDKGKVLVRIPSKQAELYDPKNDVWTRLPDLVNRNGDSCYGVVVRGKMHVVQKRSPMVQILDNETQVWTESVCPWVNYPLAVVGDAVYVFCKDGIYHETQVGQPKQLKFRAFGYEKRSEFAMTSLGNTVYLIGGKESRGSISSTTEHEFSNVIKLTFSLEEPWESPKLHWAKPMTRCRGSILGCTTLSI